MACEEVDGAPTRSGVIGIYFATNLFTTAKLYVETDYTFST